MKKIFLAVSLFAISSLFASQVERFALIVGKNDGGDNRKVLRYAEHDAQSFRNVLMELGGLEKPNTIMLADPSIQQLKESLREIAHRVGSKKGKARREFFFYYSGHSDDLGLLIDRQRLDYRDLKKMLDQVFSDVSVVVLDSCSSGNFTALKGGKRVPPFINPSSTSLKGKVFLASSSSNEYAQESEKLKGSFFTHNLVSALRGAADHHPDGLITLNEAYQYAYNETLAQTESSIAGGQHPSYSIQLMGNGELVMTDLKEASGQILFDISLDGLVYVRDQNDQLIAEVRKFPGKVLAIAVLPGTYRVGVSSKNAYATTSVQVGESQKIGLAAGDFTTTVSEYHQSKGEDRPVDVVNVEFSLIPDLSTYQYETERRSLHHFSLSLLYSRYEILEGGAISVGANIVDEYMRGAQFSLVGNMSKGQMEGAQFTHGLNYVQDQARGVQVSGFGNYAGFSDHLYQFSSIANHLKDGGKGAQISAISNTSFGNYTGAQITAISNITQGDIRGVQLAAVFNKAKTVKGAQLGLVNIADQVEGVSLGAVNLIKKNGEIAVGYRYDDLGFNSVFFRSGTNNFYTIFQASHDSDYDLFGVGIGAKYLLGFSEIGVEYSGLSLKPDYFHQTDALTISRLGLTLNPYRTKYLNFILAATYNHLTTKDDAALESFNSFREDSRNAWFGYQVGLEYRF